MERINKILGKHGRITIPWEIRQEMGFAYNDVVSFEKRGDKVIVRREKLCNNCSVASVAKPEPEPKEVSLLELLDSLSPSEQRAALIHLSEKWARMQSVGDDDA